MPRSVPPDPPPDPTPELPDELEDALAELFLRSRVGLEPRLEALLSEHPDRADALRARVAEMRRLELAREPSRAPGAAAGGPGTIGGPGAIGPYELVRELGRGGMGTVYLARQAEPLQRLVAIKVLERGSREVMARFEFERQALAVMSHPAIARLFDAGVSRRGEPYFVMEAVDGPSLVDYCDAQRLRIEERIRLFQEVCHGVQHAHRRGLLHRDLKPANLLVDESGGAPAVKIIDFGLARAVDERLAGDSVQTLHGQLLGTPEYMSPEQAAGDARDIDTRTDVYSLGVVLYELLCGELPVRGEDLRSGSSLGLLRRILESDPPPPSARIMARSDGDAVLAARGASRSALVRRLRGELDWITQRAMAHEPGRRYESPDELARDLDHCLRNEPVEAGPPSASYRARKFVRRNRGAVLAAGLLAASLLVGAVAAGVQYLHAQESERRARASAESLAHKIADYDRLSGVVLLDRARAGELGLYPAWPGNVGAMEAWLAGDARELLSMAADLTDTISHVRARARPQTREERRSGSFSFDADLRSQAFLHDTLLELAQGITRLGERDVPRVEERLRWARWLAEGLSLHHPGARSSWGEVRAALAASPRYAGLDLALADEDLMDLVPIGPNPVTGYWEFYHLPSAWDGSSDPRAIRIPEHRPDGSLEVTGATGIVFVLLPGGEALLGSQATDPGAPNHDPLREESERLHAVSLAPFFLARYELTQGQWARLWRWDSSRRRPSRYAAGGTIAGQRITPANPVEMVDWTMCQTVVERYGLSLPTEAQWEYACRAGTSTMYGAELGRLREVANLADAAGKRAYPAWDCESWDDGYVVHAPVGSFTPNAFGLHDMHGNVWEWCRDWFGEYGRPRAGDGWNEVASPAYRCYRGGGARLPAIYARAGHRDYDVPTYRNATLGLRPARELHPAR